MNGDDFLVSINLYTALEHLHHLKVKLPIWIDAICINQKNAAEKAVQVAQMRTIYEHAFSVVVWLGEEKHPTTKHAVDILEGQSAHFAGWLAIGQDLLKREWWWRMWVIQEVAVARSVICLCGPYEFTWWDLAYAENKARTDNVPIFHHTEEELLAGNIFLANVGPMSQYRLRFWAKEPLPILELLMNNLRCRASDPKDMIYSLMGFATDVTSVTPSQERRHGLEQP